MGKLVGEQDSRLLIETPVLLTWISTALEGKSADVFMVKTMKSYVEM